MYPDMCFHFNKGELDVANPSVGDFAEITMTVEVTGIDKDGISLMKHGPVKVTKPFKEVSSEQMKEKIGTVEDETVPHSDNAEYE